jgi:hypothetical protein
VLNLGQAVSVERFIGIQFCDDVRQEIGGKFSLIGCYSGAIQVHPMPSVLPKLCALVKVYTPIEKPFGKLVIRLLRGEVPIAEIPFACEKMATPGTYALGARWAMFYGVFSMSPFQVEAPCVLRVEADTEEGILLGGVTQIIGADATSTR